jgi:hypothetical protein
MRRTRLTLATAAAACLLALASAQTATHGVAVHVPDYFGIRIVGAGPGPRLVTFDYEADPDAYAAALQGAGRLLPTAVARFDDIQIKATRNGRWNLDVVATPLAYAGGASGAGFALADIRVVRGVRSGLAQTAIFGPGNSAGFVASWVLSTAPQRIAFRNGSTQGWKSLGFNGLDYEIAVQGDEDAGAYTTLVTYLLTAP